MTGFEAEIIGQKILKGVHLERLGWKVRAKVIRPWTTIGETDRRRKVVYISLRYVQANEEPVVREILIHEIAHALTVGGHTDLWQRVCKRLGGSGGTHYRIVNGEGRAV